MAFLFDPAFWARWVSIVILDLTLAGDNALVIALAVRTLPKCQRIAGQIWGAGGAVVLRLVFVGIVSLLLRVPFLQLVGGLLLVWISVKLVRPETGGEGNVRHGSSLWEAIWLRPNQNAALKNMSNIAGLLRSSPARASPATVATTG